MHLGPQTRHPGSKRRGALGPNVAAVLLWGKASSRVKLWPFLWRVAHTKPCVQPSELLTAHKTELPGLQAGEAHAGNEAPEPGGHG